MTLQQIKNFIAVVEIGSFNKAEEATFLTKQALKKQIDTLESELGFKLIKRSPKGVLLTSAGEIFYRASVKSLLRFDSLLEECRSVSRNMNQIRIGNPPHPRLLLEDVFNEYTVRYPDIHQEIVITKENLVQKVLDGYLDVAEFIYRPSNLVDGISYQKIKNMEYTCVMINTHPLAFKSSITAEDLLPYQVGMVGKANCDLFNQLHTSYPSMDIRNLSHSDMTNIINICYNQGIYISKAYFVQLLPPLITVPLQSDIKFECGVIYRTNPTPPVTKFLGLIREMYTDEILE